MEPDQSNSGPTTAFGGVPANACDGRHPDLELAAELVAAVKDAAGHAVFHGGGLFGLAEPDRMRVSMPIEQWSRIATLADVWCE